MKNVYFLVVLIFLNVNLFAEEPYVYTDDKGVKHITVDSEENIDKFEEGTTFLEKSNLQKFQLQDALKKAVQETLTNGKNYFVLVNSGTNNLYGFPITNYKDLRDYCFAYHGNKLNDTDFQVKNNIKKGKCDIWYKDGVRISILPIEKKPTDLIFAWDAKQVLTELN